MPEKRCAVAYSKRYKSGRTENGEAWFVSLGRQNSTLTFTMRLQRRKCATLDAHLRSCHFCSADALARVQMKRTIQVAGKRFTPTAEFHRRVRHGIAPKPQGSLGLGCTFVAAAVMVVLGTFQASKELDPAEIKFLARLQTCTWQASQFIAGGCDLHRMGTR